MTVGFSDPIVNFGVTGLADAFEARLVTPLQAAEVYLERIERLNPALNAFLAVDRAGVLRDADASARRWAAGTPRSAIDGAPVGIKVNIAVEGLPWHAGIAAYRARIADQDAACVAALREAGAVILGVLNMHEAALGATNDNLAFGRCHNPYRFDFTPGGSSGGSASAVAAGLCAAALGTDTMGSVRMPAAFCGLFGHKPTHGLISTQGVVPLSKTLDDVGVLARSAADLSAMMHVLAPSAAAAPPVEGSPGRRCAVIDVSGHDLDEAVADGVQRSVARAKAAGWRIEPLTLESWDAAALRRLALLVVEVEALATHQAMLARDPAGFSPALSEMLNWAARQPQAKVASAYRDLAAAADALRRDLSAFDAAILPATPGPAASFDSPPLAGQADFTVLANVAGFAATAFPTGLSDGGLPVSAQIFAQTDDVAITLAGALATPPPPPTAFR